jgi:cation diffusion facilitator CzcD-associated flavoprotein CzcO
MPHTEHDVIILGAGMSGIAMGAQLLNAGRTDFLILEEADGVGGTWWHNRYPGAQCDVPSHLYCFSFALNPRWTHVYARGDEIQRYAEDCVTRLGLTEHLRLGCRILSAEFDDTSGRWLIKTANGWTIRARHFVASMGPLHRPRLPPDISLFKGTVLHTARWDPRVDLTGKRVAIIGTAASAVQVIPAIVSACAQLHVFQRTPSWVIPRGDRPYPRWIQQLLGVPGIGRLYRWCLYALTEATFPAFKLRGFHPKLLRYIALRHLSKQVRDPELRAKLTPDYPVGCKRVLLTDEFYPAIQRDNVTLHGAAHGFTDGGILDENGAVIPADVVICATGFDTLAPLGALRIAGIGGKTLGDRWSDGPEAYRGTVVDGFPNLWLLLGPNTGTGHTSVLIPIEAQAQYVVKCIQELDRRKRVAMVIQAEAVRSHNALLQARLSETVWASARCASWYKTADGRVLGTYPGFISQFRWSLKYPRFADFTFYS